MCPLETPWRGTSSEYLHYRAVIDWNIFIPITKTRLCNFDPRKPHFYIVKLGFTGVYIIFPISAQKHRLWVLVRTASLRRFQRVPTIYVLSRNVKKYQEFLCENFQFLEVKFSIYLNRRVFVMDISIVSIAIYRIINVYYLKVGFCHVEIQKSCYINLVLRTEGIWASKVFSYFLHIFSFITVMLSQIIYYVFAYYDIPEDAMEITVVFM